MRVVLFTGKGGVGKTTSAAATAVRAARSGLKTLVLSTDPAHSLGDALGVPLGAGPTEVCAGLYGMQINAQRRFEESWDQLRGYLMTLAHSRAGSTRSPPRNSWSCRAPRRSSRCWRCASRRCPGCTRQSWWTARPPRRRCGSLALPEALRWYFDRLYPTHRRLARTVRPLLGSAAGLPGDDVLDAAERLYRQLAAVQELLTDPETTSVRLVLTPESVVLAEARRTFTSLALYGFAVDGVIANRVIPAGGDDPWRSSWAAAQAVQLAEARNSFGGLPVYAVPYLPAEPVGVDALGELAELTYGELDPLALVPVEPTMRITRDGPGRYRLSLALPLAEKGDVALGRSAEDLVVTVGGHRRLVALPETLRRCEVAGAALAGGHLTVSFAEQRSAQ